MANRLSPKHLQFRVELNEMARSKNFLTWKCKFSSTRAVGYILSQSPVILLLSRSTCFKSQGIHCPSWLATRASLAGVNKRGQILQALACPPCAYQWPWPAQSLSSSRYVTWKPVLQKGMKNSDPCGKLLLKQAGDRMQRASQAAFAKGWCELSYTEVSAAPADNNSSEKRNLD